MTAITTLQELQRLARSTDQRGPLRTTYARVGCMPAKALICGGKCILRSDKSLMNSEFTVGISLSLTARLCFFASSHCGTIKNRVGVTRVVVEVTKKLRAANSNPVTRPTMGAS